jgi:hypothetical protein
MNNKDKKNLNMVERTTQIITSNCARIKFTQAWFIIVMKDVRDQFQNNFQISPLAHPLGIEGVYWNHNIKYRKS